MHSEEAFSDSDFHVDSAEIGLGPEWLWVSPGKPVPQRLYESLAPRSCLQIRETNPTDFQLSNRHRLNPGGQIFVLDGSAGQCEMNQLWLRHLRRDVRTSAMPILIWSHDGELPPFDPAQDHFRLLPDGVIGRRGWHGRNEWIRRIESILKVRLKRQFHLDTHLDISSRIESLDAASAWLLATARIVPWIHPRSGRLRQALFELGQNAIEWGNRGDLTKTVHIRLRADERSLHLSVSDQGPGFDRKNLPHAADDQDPIRHLEIREQLGLREGGFGLMITRGLVDRIVYNASGNTVHVTMRHNKA